MSTTLSSYKELIPADRHGANGGVVRKHQFLSHITGSLPQVSPRHLRKAFRVLPPAQAKTRKS